MQTVEAHGASIPVIGLGTWELRGRACARLVEQALRLGYRHVDTAQMYENEREVGEGVRASGVKRSDVFVTTKVWTTHFAPNDLLRSTKESLVHLRMSEVDLLLLHWPNPQVPLEETLGGLAEAQRLGLTRHVGVSNFTVALIEEAVAKSTAPLVCNQVEYHPYLEQNKVLAACRAHDMALVAYSPVAKGHVKDAEVLSRGVAAAHLIMIKIFQRLPAGIPLALEDVARAETQIQAAVAEQVDVGGIARQQRRRVERRVQHVGTEPDA